MIDHWIPVVSLIICLIQLAYWFFFFLNWRKISNKPEPSNSIPKPGVSVIVCAHDEEENLRVLLPLLLEQDYPTFEIIIVEDRCNDGSYDFLLKETAKHSRVRTVRIKTKPDHIPGKKYALTLGIKAAQFETVLLTDADCRPVSQSWIYSMMKCFGEKTQIVVGLSPYDQTSGLLNGLIRFESILTGITYGAFTKAGNPYMGVGRNLAYRKSLFLDNKGFNQHISTMGGDDDLFVNEHATQENTVFTADPESIVCSISKKSWTSFFSQKIRHLSVGKYYKAKHKLFLAPFYVSYALSVPAIAAGLLTEQRFWVIGVWIFTTIFLYLTFYQVFKVSTLRQRWSELVFMDLLYSIYYLALAPVAQFTKKVSWKR